MSVLHPASFKEFRSLMCLWQALKLWKKATWGKVTYCDLEAWPLRSGGQHFPGNVSKCAMNSYAKYPAWKGLNRKQPTKINEIDYRGKDGTGANDCGRTAAHPRPSPPPPPQTVSDTFPILAFDRLSLLLRRRCQAARPPRTYSTGQLEACYLQIGEGYTRSFKCA